MAKAIKVKDLETGTESWEELDDFNRKPGGKAGHNNEMVKMHELVDGLQSVAAVKVFLHALLNYLGKA